MARKRKTKGRQPTRRRLLPGSVESGLRRIMFGTYGLGFVAIAGVAWASLATWSIYDPSFNNATQASPRNLLGHWGAAIADLAMQFLGLASIILFLPLAAWGAHLIFKTTPERRRMRLLVWPAAVMLLAAFMSALPQPKSWPLPNGLGGILGDIFMAATLFIGVLPAAAAYFVAGLTFLVVGTSLLVVRLRHQRLGADRVVGAEDQDPERMGQCLARRRHGRREADPGHHQPRFRLAAARGRAGRGRRARRGALHRRSGSGLVRAGSRRPHRADFRCPSLRRR